MEKIIGKGAKGIPMTIAERLAEALTDLSKEDGLGTKYIATDDGKITTEGGATSMGTNYAGELLEKDRAKCMRLVQIIDNCFADIKSSEPEQRDPGPGRSHTE